MIKSSTYRARSGLQRELLAAYSALEHRTTRELPDAEVDAAFRRLLARVSALLFLHGDAVPRDCWQTLRAPSTGTDDAVDVLAAFLETGRAPLLEVAAASELQQELVHFSRIVDIGSLGLGDTGADQAVRRLRNSDRIPEDLKVLSELLIVVRSRLSQRGARRPAPQLREPQMTEHELTAHTSVWLPVQRDFLLCVSSPRRRTRKEVAYLCSALLQYLTPAEAALAVWAYAVATPVRAWIDVALAETTSDTRTSSLAWSHPGGHLIHTDQPPLDWCLQHLPRVHTDAATTEHVTAHGVAVRFHPDRRLTVTEANQPEWVAPPLVPPARTAVSATHMREQAQRLFAAWSGSQIASMECGHVHLDRDLDIDQEIGAQLGAAAVEALRRNRLPAPTLTPMVDDDHVLVKLRPADYRTFLQRHFPDAGMHLIAESSPIVRSIACGLWQRLHTLGLAERCRRRGDNMFLTLDNGNHCELFEDVPGENATGCVFFETALLVYRSAPARFDTYFRERFDLADGVHEHACRILDTAGDHDEKIGRLERFYARFTDVTAPQAPDPGVCGLVESVLADAGALTHLNVLEDYYEVQQGKVRSVIDLLDLPIRLLTLHFNAHSGRLVLEGEQ